MRVIGGKYEIVRQLGEGGMGAVYEARHTGTGRRVAVKEIIGESLRKNPSVVERFQREARATGEIETQHIALVLDTGTDPETNHPYLVMEYLQGEDLQQLIARLGPLPEALALRIVAQACIGLARAHEAGVVHRDIKPANLFLARRDGGEIVVKLLDFGIARVKEQLTGPDQRGLTTTGAMLGSPLYMSPEQAQDAKNLDHRTDLWSLGVVLHEALVGRTPHGDIDTVGALIVAICSKPARPLEQVAPHVGATVCAIVKKALELEPAARYQTADELLADLKKQIPGSLTLDESMLASLPESVRANVEPKHAIELAATAPAPNPAPVRSVSTTAGVASQPMAVTAAGRSPFLRAALAACVVLGAGAVAWRYFGDLKAPIPTNPSASVERTAAPMLTFRLRVAPAGAQVEIDGHPVSVTADGNVLVSGLPGSAHAVRLTWGKDTMTRDVVVGNDRLEPSNIEIVTPAASASATASATPKPTASQVRPRSTAPGIVSGTHEFDLPKPQ